MYLATYSDYLFIWNNLAITFCKTLLYDRKIMQTSTCVFGCILWLSFLSETIWPSLSVKQCCPLEISCKSPMCHMYGFNFVVVIFKRVKRGKRKRWEYFNPRFHLCQSSPSVVEMELNPVTLALPPPHPTMSWSCLLACAKTLARDSV